MILRSYVEVSNTGTISSVFQVHNPVARYDFEKWIHVGSVTRTKAFAEDYAPIMVTPAMVHYVPQLPQSFVTTVKTAAMLMESLAAITLQSYARYDEEREWAEMADAEAAEIRAHEILTRG